MFLEEFLKYILRYLLKFKNFLVFFLKINTITHNYHHPHPLWPPPFSSSFLLPSLFLATPLPSFPLISIWPLPSPLSQSIWSQIGGGREGRGEGKEERGGREKKEERGRETKEGMVAMVVDGDDL